MPELKIISTSDGSHTLLNTVLNETYHSIHGAIQESKHVFIQAGLEYWQSQNHNKNMKVFEVGFGTGLNAILTLLHAQLSEVNTYYQSWEAFPLDNSTVRQLNYPLLLGDAEWFHKIHETPWNQPTQLTPFFTLHKRLDNLISGALQTRGFDVVYYDAFAPSKEPEMWSQAVLSKVVDLLAPGSVLVTYCAKGQVRRDLQSFGLQVETLPGPPGKRVMIRATKEKGW